MLHAYRLFAWGLLLCLLLPVQTQAKLYRWVDENGVVHFSDKAPTENGKESSKETEVYTPSTSLNELEIPQKESESPENALLNAIANDADSTVSRYNGNGHVVMYSASWCGVCAQAKAYMQARGIPYTEHDIDASSKNKKQLIMLGGRGVPLIIVGKQRMSGFNPRQLERMLANVDMVE